MTNNADKGRPNPDASVNTDTLRSALAKEYGPMMGGEDLRRALGFKTAASFARAVREKTLGLPVFNIAGRRGKFALTSDVATWLAALRSGTPAKFNQENG